jgi:hypothetical protein
MTQQTQSRQEQVIGEDRLHVVFGTGQVRSALAVHLAGKGIAARACPGTGPPRCPGRTGGPPMPPTPRRPLTREQDADGQASGS